MGDGIRLDGEEMEAKFRTPAKAILDILSDPANTQNVTNAADMEGIRAAATAIFDRADELVTEYETNDAGLRIFMYVVVGIVGTVVLGILIGLLVYCCVKAARRARKRLGKEDLGEEGNGASGG